MSYKWAEIGIKRRLLFVPLSFCFVMMLQTVVVSGWKALLLLFFPGHWMENYCATNNLSYPTLQVGHKIGWHNKLSFSYLSLVNVNTFCWTRDEINWQLTADKNKLTPTGVRKLMLSVLKCEVCYTVKNKTLWLLKSLYFSVWTLQNRDKPLKSIFDSVIEIHTLNDRVETLFYMDESLISRVISLY